MAVSKDAIVNRQSGRIVFVFEKGKVRPAAIVIGESFGGKFEILSGLRPGDKVVIKGNELLRPGQRVRVNRSGRRAGGKPDGKPSANRSGGRPNAGGSGGGIPRDKRRALIQRLSPEEKQTFFGMSREEKQKFFRDKIGSSS